MTILISRRGRPPCYDWLRQREADGRWLACYVRVHEHGRLRAAMPLYECRMNRRPESAYDPATWDVPAPVREGCASATALLVAGCAYRRSGLHADQVAMTPARLRQILVAVAQVAAERARCLVFPFVPETAKDALAAADDRIRWTCLAREPQVRGIADPG